jgi:23S rRNA pseudouridine2605 synthase
MIKNNNRNSRDDKSKPGSRSTSGRSRTGTDSSYKGKSSFGDKEGKDSRPGAADRNTTGRTEGGSSYKGKRPFTDKEPRENKFAGASRSTDSHTEGGSTYKGKRPFTDKEPRENKFGGASRSTDSRRDSGSTFKGKRPFTDKPREYVAGSKRDSPESKGRSYIKKDQFGPKGDQFAPKGDKPFRKFDDKKTGVSRSTDSRPFRKRDSENGEYRPSFSSEKAPVMRVRKDQPKVDDGLVRLNRYIANSGICSRRKADELIEAGVVSVNGEVVSELGHKVDPAKDEIRYNGELLKREKKTYVLLNKPKDYITTTDDPQERRTVMQLVEKASKERIYPVGRLDRNTTGLLLMTNDGDLADKLSHPKNGITKIYHVELNKSLSQGDLNKIQFGLELEDGLIKPDTVSYVSGGSKREVGIQIHSGKNRIVRRIFEHLGYEVVKLDRVVYGNLTKKDLPRGRWRYLEEHELIQIKHLIK